MSTNDRSTRAFDSAAADFDRLGEYLWEPIAAATVARTAPAPGERVLDACCGTGASALPTAERVGPAGLVDAVDLSEGLIDVLRRRAAGRPQLHPHVGDATAWPHDGYDVVQAVLGIFFFPDMTTGTDHLIGRARPGGRAGFTIWRRGAIETAGKHLASSVAAVTGTTPPPPRPPHLVDQLNLPDAFRTWLGERGLTDVTVTEHELRLALTPEIAWLLVTGSGYAGAVAGLDEAQAAAVRDTYLASLDAAGIQELDATTLIGVGTRT
ncbi:class I SAM-dependent methyltransferase [Nocardia carnea]|uniref:class I SAM-dependent methyltransferase n=1 Tax=Nocardia carnea TaxID=37328 RepID=UPI00245411BA|nr:class I SAM-dependent methyltransferase [Nocardia carnea]